VCGLSERPAAWTTFEGKVVKIYRSKVIEPTGAGDAGKWHISRDALYVSCAEGLLEILSLQIEGKKRMRASDFLRGYRVKGHERFV
jgi:methionyl-tRNA formyltransferase